MPALLTAQNSEGNIHLIIGSGPLAASRCAKSLEVGACPILACPADDDVHYTLTKLIDNGSVRWTQREFEDDDLKSLGREEVDGYVDAVFVTRGPRHALSVRVSALCRRLRIPVNVVDAPQLCTFTLLSTYSDGPLQIGITTSGRGCKLSSRLRREIAAALPRNLGDAIERLGTIRRRIWEEDQATQRAYTRATSERVTGESQEALELEVEDEESANQKHTFNTLVKETASPDPEVARTRRMRWLSQICEYWPLKRLADITDADITTILEAYKATASAQSPSHTDSSTTNASGKSISESQGAAAGLTTTSTYSVAARKGTITLAGSGPGHPSLLTVATHTSIQTAHYILADKLVPAEILALIPRRTPVHIARKFPGNADAAQEELLTLALAAMNEGKDVLRLKQGDPYLYGRGAEEVDFFRRHGYEARVLPGVTSALSAPLFAGIPVTHRAVADQVVICTGTGRKGAAPTPPAFKDSKTVVFLMALHRLESLVKSLTLGTDSVTTTATKSPSEGQSKIDSRQLWPLSTPCAVIERASCPDQRVIRSTLEHVCQAIEEEGSRPPGLIVVGAACAVLHTPTHGQRWVVEEGFRGLDDIAPFTTVGNPTNSATTIDTGIETKTGITTDTVGLKTPLDSESQSELVRDMQRLSQIEHRGSKNDVDGSANENKIDRDPRLDVSRVQKLGVRTTVQEVIPDS